MWSLVNGSWKKDAASISKHCLIASREAEHAMHLFNELHEVLGFYLSILRYTMPDAFAITLSLREEMAIKG